MAKNEYIEDANNPNIKISKDVLTAIALKVINSIEGVELTNPSSSFSELIGRKNNPRGIKVDIKDNDLYIDIFISLKYGSKVNEIAYDVQKKVKESIEVMTDLNLKEINVHVENIIATDDGQDHFDANN